MNSTHKKYDLPETIIQHTIIFFYNNNNCNIKLDKMRYSKMFVEK